MRESTSRITILITSATVVARKKKRDFLRPRIDFFSPVRENNIVFTYGCVAPPLPPKRVYSTRYKRPRNALYNAKSTPATVGFFLSGRSRVLFASGGVRSLFFSSVFRFFRTVRVPDQLQCTVTATVDGRTTRISYERTIKYSHVNNGPIAR